jgi:hypothetical protein
MCSNRSADNIFLCGIFLGWKPPDSRRLADYYFLGQLESCPIYRIEWLLDIQNSFEFEPGHTFSSFNYMRIQ